MVNDLERRLRFMLVASVGQNRPGVSCRQVEEALVRRAATFDGARKLAGGG
jgi:hypothetical protein